MDSLGGHSPTLVADEVDGAGPSLGADIESATFPTFDERGGGSIQLGSDALNFQDRAQFPLQPRVVLRGHDQVDVTRVSQRLQGLFRRSKLQNG